MVKLLFIGATGHIGGAVLDLIVSTVPSLDITALIRDESKAKRLCDKYPDVKTIIGDLRNVELIGRESMEADIVINTGPDVSHFLGIQRILQALEGREAKGYYIHTSGAALVWDEPDGSVAGTRIWDDIDDIATITSMPDNITHSKEDKLVFSAHPTVNVAIVSPVMVYGLSPSIEHPVPLTFPELTKAIRFLRSGFTVSTGSNLMGYVHVRDLARIYLILLGHALGSASVSGVEIWGPEAYYFGTAQELSFANLMKTMVGTWYRLGALDSKNIKEIEVTRAAEASGAAENDDPQSWAKHIAASCGVNMRVKSTRAERIGWVPREAKLEDTVDEVAAKYLEMEKGIDSRT